MALEAEQVPAADPAADERAREVEERLTDEERFSLIIGVMGQIASLFPVRDERIPEGTRMSAAYVAAVPRRGVPALHMSDASMGVTNPGYVGRESDTATAMPACIALGASFNPSLARASGRAIGREARGRGFNVQLAGGINLLRDPRNGRSFEYLSEDPWHSAVLAAGSVNGIQGEGVISTLKHFCLNCNETNRHWLDAVIERVAARRLAVSGPLLTRACCVPNCPAVGEWGRTGRCPPHRQRYGTSAWDKVKREALRRARWRCARCGSRDDVVVHHHGPSEAPTAVEVLCRRCHAIEHNLGRA